MLHQILAMYQPYVLGFKSFVSYAAGGLAAVPSTQHHTPGNLTTALDVLAKNSTYGAPCMYKSLEAAAIVLQMARELDTRLSDDNSMAKIFFTELDQLQLFFIDINRNKSSNPLKFDGKQVVILEGFDGSGKSILAEGFVSRFDRSAACSIDVNCWPEMEKIFTNLHKATSTAFKYVSCYFLARQILEADVNQTIIVERFYHSVCANTACLTTELDPRVIPETAFYWPNDLPQPDLVLFLALTKDQLDERWVKCDRPTLTEDKLKLMEIAYSFVNGPPIAAIDASMTPPEILSLVEEIMTHHSNMHLSLRPVPPSITGSSSDALHEENAEAGHSHNDTVNAVEAEAYPIDDSRSPATPPPQILEEETIVLDDVFDSENTNINYLRKSKFSTRGHNPKQLNSRRSSLGVYGAFPELSKDGWE